MPSPNPPTVKQLRLDHLMVDREVQRALQTGRANRIAEKFRPEAFGVLVVSMRRDGSYHVIDGQHRRAAAIITGREEWVVDCQVYEGLTREQEAAMFLLLNERAAVMPLEKFLVRIVEGEPVANRLTEILAKHHWTVRCQPTDGSFAAVAALEKVARGAGVTRSRDNYEIVDLTISILTHAWGHKTEAVSGVLVVALGSVLLRYGGQVDVPKLLDQLSEHEGGPRALVGRGRGLAKMRGGRVTDGVADVMVNLHNKGKREGRRLPDWRSNND